MTATRAPYRPHAFSMRVLAVVVAGYEKMSGVSGYLRPDPRPVDRTLRMTVTEVLVEARDVVSLRLEPIDQRWVPRWHPGAHVDVELGPGLVRQYSLCGDPAQRDHLRIAVRRIADGGGGSRRVHELAVGDTLAVRGPRNAFPFVDAGAYLFVAGGIGITPILPMVREAARRGADWQLVFTGRDRASIPFVDELRAIDAGRVHLRPDDEFGVPTAADILARAPHGAALYLCGPPPMVEAVRAAVPDGRVTSVHHERFSAPPVVGGSPFEVVLARSGHVVQVAADETALQAVRRVLPDVAYSCQQGYCGTCPARLLGGAVEHRDRCLGDEQRATLMALCVSRGTGRITLDL